MKSTNRIVSALALTIASLSAQAATLSVGDNLMIESINGHIADSQPVQLSAGKHLVELRFSERYYTNAGSSGTWVRSTPLFTTVTLTEGEVLTLNTPEIITEAQAREYVRQPQALLSSEQGRNEQLELKTQTQLMSQLLTSL